MSVADIFRVIMAVGPTTTPSEEAVLECRKSISWLTALATKPVTKCFEMVDAPAAVNVDRVVVASCDAADAGLVDYRALVRDVPIDVESLLFKPAVVDPGAVVGIFSGELGTVVSRVIEKTQVPTVGLVVSWCLHAHTIGLLRGFHVLERSDVVQFVAQPALDPEAALDGAFLQLGLLWKVRHGRSVEMSGYLLEETVVKVRPSDRYLLGVELDGKGFSIAWAVLRALGHGNCVGETRFSEVFVDLVDELVVRTCWFASVGLDVFKLIEGGSKFASFVIRLEVPFGCFFERGMCGLAHFVFDDAVIVPFGVVIAWLAVAIMNRQCRGFKMVAINGMFILHPEPAYIASVAFCQVVRMVLKET